MKEEGDMMVEPQKNIVDKGNLKLSVFVSCPYDEIKNVCDSIVALGYDCEFVDNGNIVFQKIQKKEHDTEYDMYEDNL